jgi:hypothetical protein
MKVTLVQIYSSSPSFKGSKKACYEKLSGQLDDLTMPTANTDGAIFATLIFCSSILTL